MDRIHDVLASSSGQGPGMTRAAQMLGRPDALMGGGAPADPAGFSFSNVLVDAIENVRKVQNESSTIQKAFQQGDPEVGVETTMIAMNKASLSFQMLVQARNRVIAAYNEVMNMQI